MVEVVEASINGARVEIAPDYNTLSHRLTEVYLARIAIQPDLRTLTSTGVSPLGWYGHLAEHEARNPGTFRDVSFYNLDEYCWVDEDGCRLLDPDDQRSYRYYMAPIAGSLGVKASHFPGPENYSEPGTYDNQIKREGGIDFAVQGLGMDHTCGFNFSGSPFDSVTRCVEVSDLTRKVNGALTETDTEAIPNHAITVGISTVMKVAEVWTIAYGERKREPVWRALNEPTSPANPATALRQHRAHTFLIDEQAAALLDR